MNKLGITTANNQGYELTFAGKGLAKHKAETETTQKLQYVPEQSKDTGDNADTENMIIRGDNLDVLKILKQNYTSKIKMIYIDPPYNTGKENFVYNDNFKQSERQLIDELGLNEQTADFLENMYGTRSHSGWLSFMYPRLKVARELLTDDGVIFISIDDNEQANLKILCDEIFGESNFVGQFVLQTNPRGRSLDKHIAKTFEYILLFSKNIDEAKVLQVPKSGASMKEYNKEDTKGKYRLLELRNRQSSQFNRQTRPNLFYPIYINPTNKEVSLEKKGAFTECAYPRNSKNEDGCWTWGKDKTETEKSLLLGKKTSNGDWRVFRKDYVPEEGATTKEKSLWLDSDINHEQGKKIVTSLMGASVFDFPKSPHLVSKTLCIGSEKGDIILDFFGGSGTTAHAVMDMNAQDGGKRQFIIVQWDEAIGKLKTQAYDFCIENNLSPVISSITIERINRAGDKIKSENPDADIDIGYRVFTLTDKRE